MAAVRIAGLDKRTQIMFRRSLALLGAGSQSKWLQTRIRLFIRQAQERFGDDLFEVLTEEERQILEVIASGAAEIQHICEETLLQRQQAERLIHELCERGLLMERKKGGKTEQARGAKVSLYFVIERKNKAA
jgi:DNA replication initiation complex subunit (GINS family)